jgi:hypothetical protein
MVTRDTAEKQSSILERTVRLEAELDRIEAHRQAQTCSICCKHLDYADGCYTVNHSHYNCAFPTGYKTPEQTFKDAEQRMDQALATFGFRPKRKQARIGEGGPTKKLKIIIEDSAKEHFGAEDVTDINLYLPPPVWRQHRFDVQRVEGSMLVDGRRIMFGSWVGVSKLVKYRRVTWVNDWPALDMNPVLETKRTRQNATQDASG